MWILMIPAIVLFIILLRILLAFIKGLCDGPRSKNTAVVLAVFFSFWAWLYVFTEENQWKFWLNLCLTIVTLGIWGIVAWIWAIIDLALKPIGYYEKLWSDGQPES